MWRLAFVVVLLITALSAQDLGNGSRPERSVAVVLFSNLECKVCGSLGSTLINIRKAHPNELAVVFKHSPQSLQGEVVPAYLAETAAEEQGRLWEMHDLLLADNDSMTLGDLDRYALQLGLNITAFREALRSRRCQEAIERDLAEAEALGVTKTPTVFVNGKRFEGLNTPQKLKAVVDAELGLTSHGAYGAIETQGSPTIGRSGAPVTIITFSDFQCPFCSRAAATLKALEREFPNHIKVVFKQFPLEFHHDAMLAHVAGLAADGQGRFWEMHDRIFASQQALKRNNLLQMALELGLDMERFEADLDSTKLKKIIEEDKSEGVRLGVTGTPTLFINGRKFIGGRPLAELERVILAELKDLNPSVAVAGEDVGSAEVPITVEWFGDIQSPLSVGARKLIKEIQAAYAEKIVVVYKNTPLGLHPGADLSHEAALAAGEQGKFWEMHDLILAAPAVLTKDDLLALGSRLGLIRASLEKALDKHTFRGRVEADLAEARRRDIRGVPVFFVNGKRIDGIQPISVFRDYIDAELAQVKVEGLLGTAR